MRYAMQVGLIDTNQSSKDTNRYVILVDTVDFPIYIFLSGESYIL